MRVFEMPFPTTRGALEQTLLRLGYTPTTGTNEFGFPFVAYRHEAGNALISLRAASPEDPLTPSDLLSAEHSVEWWGVASREQFYRLLREATPAEAQIA